MSKTEMMEIATAEDLPSILIEALLMAGDEDVRALLT